MNIYIHQIQSTAVIQDSSTSLVSGDIQVWALYWPHCADPAQDAGQLTGAEISRAVRFARAEDRLRFLLGRITLKKLLGMYSGIPWQVITLSQNEHGKPYWLHPSIPGPIHFNLSHSGEYILLSFSKDTPVGIDVEKIKPEQNVDSIIQRFFHPHEAAWLREFSGLKRIKYFYRFWTMKEALLKGIGSGLTVSTESFYLETSRKNAGSDYYAVGESDLFSSWKIRPLHIAPGYAASVAYEKEPAI